MNIVEYLTMKLGEPAKDGDRLAFPCPRPGCHKSTPHFRVKLDRKGGVGHCVKCSYPPRGSHMDIYGVIAELEGMRREDAKKKIETIPSYEDEEDPLQEFLNRDEGRELDLEDFEETPRSFKKRAALKPVVPDKEACLWWDETFLDIMKPRSPLGERIKNYLYERNIGMELIRKYRLRYCDRKRVRGRNNIGRRFHARIMIPVLQRGKIVYWQGRSIKKDSKMKYKNPVEGLDVKIGAKDTLFGLDAARGKSLVIVVEGIIDAIKIGPGALALLGKGLDHERMEMIKENGATSMILFFDKDVPGEERRKMLDVATAHMEDVKWTESRTMNKDAGDMGATEIADTLKMAKPQSFEDSLGLDD